MRILASRIANELEKAKHCGIYEPELSRVWPPNGASREAEIAYFREKVWLALAILQGGILRNLR